MSNRFKARPTVYKGIRMRSRLEAGFAAWLDTSHFDWEYEPCAFATEQGQYLPDFRLRNVFVTWAPEPVTIYIEVKPDSWAAQPPCACPNGQHTTKCDQARLAAWEEQDKMPVRAEIIHASDPGAWLILMRPTAGYDVYHQFGGSGLFDPVPVTLLEVHGPRVGFRLSWSEPPGPWQGEYWKAGGGQ